MQANSARLGKRELTGVGFYCTCEIPSEIERLALKTFTIADVNAELNKLSHGAGFVLFIAEGALDVLEGFTYDEPWPEKIQHFALTYQNDPRKLEFCSQPGFKTH